jgi:hypothetical protein
MAQVRICFFALLLAICMVGCGGSEYRFGNSRTLPNLSGQWAFTATSQTMSQQYQGTANVAQSDLGLQGIVKLLFNYCAPSATVSGLLEANPSFSSTSVTSYGIAITLQENVAQNSGPQEIDLTGTVSADGTKMSGTYTAPVGSCTSGDTGVWTANKN